MQAIETAYKGRLFRSRLEARWAVFFDALKIQWQYEPEGYKLSDGTCYLPDFKITTPQGQTRWFEIKPLGTSGDSKFELFSRSLDELNKEPLKHAEGLPAGEAFLAAGSPLELMENGYSFCPRCGSPVKDEYCQTVGHYEGYEFGCWACDMETECGGGNPTYSDGLMGLSWTPYKGCIRLEGSECSKYVQVFKTAAQQAQMARFEHGQSGYRRRPKPKRYRWRRRKLS